MNAPISLHNLLPVSGLQQGTDVIHESAHLHVTGGATFTDDMPELAGTLYAAIIKSPVAHGELIGDGIDRDAILKAHGVVAVYTAKDIPGENNCGPIIHDDPFLADGKVEFLGQAVAVVVAREMLYAREAAHKAKVLVKELTPILTIEEAMAASSFIMPPKGITRGDAAAAIANAPHKIKGSTNTGQQEQFYLEGQITYAVPKEDGQLTLYVSTQHPDGNQREAAHALNLHTNDVEVICRRMGGGFGGKEGNASIFSQSAALAAFKLQKPVKLRVNRDDDMMITGKRHDFRIDYDVGFDDSGRILGLDATLYSRCGYSTDYSGPVNDRALLHIDNCYHIPNLKVMGHRCKTHMQSATAFRGFGGPQGMFGVETMIEQIANTLGKDPLDVRRANLYRDPAVSGDPSTMVTQYGQRIEDWIGDKVLDQLEVESAYRARRASVNAFNASHPQRAVEIEAVLHRDDGVLGRVDDERGGRAQRHLLFHGKLHGDFPRRTLPEQRAPRGRMGVGGGHRDHGENEDHEVGPSAHRVKRRPGAPFGIVEEGSDAGGQMAAGRAAKQADAIRHNAELNRTAPHDPHRPQRVAQRRGMAVFPVAVFQQEHGDARLVQPARDFPSTGAGGHTHIATARSVNDRGPGGGSTTGKRRIHDERRPVDVQEASALLALRPRIRAQPGNSFRPQLDHPRLPGAGA